MNPGELRHKITIQKLTIVTNDNGFEEEQWIDFKSPRAKIENLSGREYYAAAAVQAEKTIKFTIRYLKEIDTTMRIKFGKKLVNGVETDRLYNITFIDNLKYGNKYIEIKALEVE